VRAFVTGATGFIGARVAGLLRARGDEVVALVRSARSAAALSDLGCELVEGDVTSPEALERGARGTDAALPRRHVPGRHPPI
jgi:dihydroflavonol-4-reductase